MADKLRIGVVWDWSQDALQLMTWEDGLFAALQELIKRGHSLELYTTCEALQGSVTRGNLTIRTFTHPDQLEALIGAYKPSVLLHWADATRPNAQVGRKLGIKQAICFAGGNPLGPTWQNFDMFFVESEDYKQKLQAANVDVMTAFGTNTTLYDPDHEFVKGQAKIFDICFQATF